MTAFVNADDDDGDDSDDDDDTRSSRAPVGFNTNPNHTDLKQTTDSHQKNSLHSFAQKDPCFLNSNPIHERESLPHSQNCHLTLLKILHTLELRLSLHPPHTSQVPNQPFIQCNLGFIKRRCRPTVGCSENSFAVFIVPPASEPPRLLPSTLPSLRTPRRKYCQCRQDRCCPARRARGEPTASRGGLIRFLVHGPYLVVRLHLAFGGLAQAAFLPIKVLFQSFVSILRCLHAFDGSFFFQWTNPRACLFCSSWPAPGSHHRCLHLRHPPPTLASVSTSTPENPLVLCVP